MPQRTIREAGSLASTASGPGRRLLTLITPGRGSSGTYSAEMLQQAAKDKAFPRGTQGHVDHDSLTERREKPEGSLRNLALVTLEDAWWDPNYVDPDTGTKGRLAAESRIASAWRDFVEEFGEFIGVSINAAAEINESGDVTRIVPDPFNRADLVTVAGRGGRVGEALEAARVIESRSIVATEATADDVRMWLTATLRTANPQTWIYLADHDEQFAYYEAEDRPGIWRQAYTLDGVDVTLTDEPVEVRRRVEYDPVTPTDSPTAPAGVAEKKEGATMATIDDAELQTLRENASRAAELEQELATERKNREDAAREARQDKALAAVTEAFGKDGQDVPALYINAAQSAAESETYDHDAFTAMVNEAAKALASAHGAGNPSGVGETVAPVAESARATDRTDRTDDIVAHLG